MTDPDVPVDTTEAELRAEDRHPDLDAALDRSKSLADRRESYARWRNDLGRHFHVARGWHTHPGGADPFHTH